MQKIHVLYIIPLCAVPCKWRPLPAIGLSPLQDRLGDEMAPIKIAMKRWETIYAKRKLRFIVHAYDDGRKTFRELPPPSHG